MAPQSSAASSRPPFGLSRGLVGFVLTSLVVWWGGWPFVSSAWRSLRHGELTMMTLIATGVLVSYAYSVAVTLGLPGEMFYAAAAQSEHPLATAVVEAAKTRGLPVDPSSDFEAVPGHGVLATVSHRTVLVGSRKLLERHGVTAGLDKEAERLRAEAKTALYVAADGRMLGLIAVADRIRPTGGSAARSSRISSGPRSTT